MKNKRISFDQLHQELEVLSPKIQRKILGGVDTSNGYVTQWLSQVLGVPVTSSTDEYGNWTVSINGGAYVPLVFTLGTVEIQSQAISFIKPDQFTYTQNPFGVGNWDFVGGNGGPGGSEGGGGIPPTDTTFEQFTWGSIEKITLNHLDAYNFMDGVQSANTQTGIAATIAGLNPTTTAAAGFLGAVATLQNLQWANIETLYMNSGNLNGINITKTVTYQMNFPTPYVSWTIYDSNGNLIGTATGPGY